MKPTIITSEPVHGSHARKNLSMEYEFPLIININDVLPAIEGRDEFNVSVKEGYTVINYNVMFEDTFPPIKVAGGSPKMRAERALHNALRRECRGIIFDTVTGDILRRPYHKFFNVNERDETQDHIVDMSVGHSILEKLDGSMIAPFIVNENMIWGTKMGATDVAKPVEDFVKNNPHYAEFAETLIKKYALTPIFEWCSRKQRIVIDHPEDMLILTGIRNRFNGDYVLHRHLHEYVRDKDIPIVKAFKPQTDMKEFINYVVDLEETEGFVVRFNSGHMVKLKCHWYINLHKAKEAILQDRNIVQLIIDNSLDDIKAHLSPEDRVKIEQFETDFNNAIIKQYRYIIAVLYSNAQKKIDRKTFALNHAQNVDRYARGIVFKNFEYRPDIVTPKMIRDDVLNTIRNNLTKTVKYEEIRDAWFSDVKYNAE